MHKKPGHSIARMSSGEEMGSPGPLRDPLTSGISTPRGSVPRGVWDLLKPHRTGAQLPAPRPDPPRCWAESQGRIPRGHPAARSLYSQHPAIKRCPSTPHPSDLWAAPSLHLLRWLPVPWFVFLCPFLCKSFLKGDGITRGSYRGSQFIKKSLLLSRPGTGISHTTSSNVSRH